MLPCEIFFSASMEDCRCRMSCVNCRLLCTRWFTPSWIMFHSSLELTWNWPVLSCLCIWRFLLVMFGNNTWVEHNWKATFLFNFFPGSQLLWRVVRSNASLWDIFFSASMEDVCRCHKSCVNCRLLCTRWFTPSWIMFHSSLELTWKWPVLSCLCIWRFLLLMFVNNTWVEHNWKAIFLFNFFPSSQLFWRVVRSIATLWDIFFCFDGRLVSLPQVLCKLSVALHSIIHTIVKHVPLLFGVDVEMTCSLLSLHLTFYACDVWE